ncbi:MAG: hypothetical protein CSA49_04955 [Gammaproteobacteria bacterium]|nr:MAG: hypothetical protein CSA49_04955 [Gammaproteobacteria bacterium]
MQHNLPNFDKLKELAESNPEELERLRTELCEQLIHEAPEKYRRKLLGLQFRIDMERRKAKSPMAACISISGMMHDSFDKLRMALNEAAGAAPTGILDTHVEDTAHAKVIPFRK